jgi:hypothetical protein
VQLDSKLVTVSNHSQVPQIQLTSSVCLYTLPNYKIEIKLLNWLKAHCEYQKTNFISLCLSSLGPSLLPILYNICALLVWQPASVTNLVNAL